MDESRVSVAKVIAKAWSDEAYRKRLHSHPHEALAEMGLKVPANQGVTVLEDSEDKIHVVIPNKPKHLTADKLASTQVHADFCKFFC